jgi:polyvinyl alcohol dehydrogenase (cytochrome)
MRPRGILVFAGAAIAVLALARTLQESTSSGQWSLAGQDLNNSRNQPAETQISPANVSSLTLKWIFTTAGDVSATPTVYNNAVYVPDWAGNLLAIGKDTGQPIWSRQISAYDGVAGAISRVSPAIHGNDIIIGDIESELALHNGANLIAVDRTTGNLHWVTQVDSQGMAIITGSPVVYRDTVFVGISSSEEGLAIKNSYPCCIFRGSIVAVDANTGKILWKTYDVPANGGVPGGYSGGAVWQPSLYWNRQQLYCAGFRSGMCGRKPDRRLHHPG